MKKIIWKTKGKIGFVCSVCRRDGFISVHTTKDGNIQCTRCANEMRKL